MAIPLRFKLGAVRALDGTVAVDVTAFMPLGITKQTTIRLSVPDATQLVERVKRVLAELGPADTARRLT